MDVERSKLTRDIAYALWRNYKLRPNSGDLDEFQRWAVHVVDHLELCRYEFHKKPERPLHSTP